MFKDSKNYLRYGKLSLGVSLILYFIKLYMTTEGKYFIGGSDVGFLSHRYVEVLLWSMFFAFLGIQLLIIGSLKKDK